MGPLKRAFVCLLILIPLANSEQKGQKSPRDVGLISGKIMSFTGAGQHDLRANIPGEPGVDYPIYSSPPDTSFSCLNRHEGYYADVETRCQVFRICSHTDHTGKGFAFLCPNGTLFSQHDFVCDWYRNVPCESSPNYYFMNELLDKSVSPHPELLMKDVVAMVNYPMKVMKQQEIFKKILPQPPRIVSTTPRPAPISFPTQPQNFRKPPTLVQPVIPPVRNPFQTETKQPDPKLFEPVTDLPHVQQPQPLQPQFENVPHSQNIEQPRQELFTPAPPTTPPTAPELTQPIPENQQAINHYDPSKVYISSLGELSTDPGSNFDPSTAIIIPDKSQEQSPIFTQAGNQEHLLQGKLEPIQSQANKNLLLNLENIASSIPGNINSQLALIRDQPLSEGEVVQIPGTLHVSLNYTQRINTALKNVLIPSTAQDQIAINPLLSGDGKLVSEIYGQNQLQDNNGILKFAHNINSAFQVNNPALGDGQSQQAIEPKDLLNSKGIGSTSKGFGFTSIDTPYGPDGKIKPQQYPTAPGPQTLQGIGFSKSNIAVSTPASVLHTQTIYIPSINLKALGQPVTTSGGTATFKRITNRGRRLQSTTHIIQNSPSQLNESNGSKSTKSKSPYVNIPGTKISIAKSIEEGFFSVSNYPLMPNTNKAMSFSSIFPGIIIHPGSPFMLRQKSDLDSNFLFPFSTISPRTQSDKSTTLTTTTKSPIVKATSSLLASTPIPSLTSIPLTQHTAQRRSDAFDDDDDEGSFFKGVSSYHVPISSVGRLPADIKGTKKR